MAEIRSLYGRIKLTDEASGAINKLKASMEGFKAGLHNVNNVMEALGGAYIVEKIREFGAELVRAGAEEETAMLRLRHLAGDGYDKVKESIEGAVEASKGLADDSDLAVSANAALKFGASIEFVRNNMKTLQQLSHVMGEDINETFQGIQNAINTGSIRFLRQSPILVKHIDEFKKIGNGYDEATKKRRELFMTQILSNEQLKISQQYAEVLETTNGLLAKMGTQWHKVKEILGGVISTAFKPIIKVIANILEWFTKSERGIAILKTAFVIFATFIGVVLVAALYAAASAAIAFLIPLLPIIAIAAAIAAAIGVVVLVVNDLWVFFHGGESVTGKLIKKFKEFIFWVRDGYRAFKEWLGPFKIVFETIEDIIGMFISHIETVVKFILDIPSIIKNAFRSLKDALPTSIKNFFGIETQTQTAKVPGKAVGGPVLAGKPYVVGERGPELFTPSTNGNIIPNGMASSNRLSFETLVGNLTINVSGPREAGQAVEMAVMEALNKLSRTIMRSEMGMAAQ